MIRKTALKTAGIFAAAILLTGCGTEADNAGASNDIESIELTVSNIQPAGSTSTVLLQEWMDAVTEASGGAVTFDYYGDGTLHPSAESLSALTSGLTDITFVNNGSFPDQLPVSNWDDLVVQTALSDFGYPNMNVAGLAQQVVHYSAGNVALEEMREQGFMPLLPMLSGPAALTCSEPFETANDLKGRQVRVANAIAQAENEALGMTGVFAAPNEQYEALQRGVIDCAVNAPTTVLAGGLLEVSPHVAFTNNAPSAGANWVISATTWDALSPALQEIFMQNRADAFTNFAVNTLDQYAEIAEAAEAAGGSIIDAAELNPLIADYWSSRPDVASSAPGGVDAAASVTQTQKIAEAWREFSVETLETPVNETDILEVLTQGSEIIDWAPWTSALAENLGAE